MSNPEIIFKREKICQRFDIGKNTFYKLAEVPGSPIKKVQGVWACVVDQMAEFVRQYPPDETPPK